jgi:hypothetical protein
MRRLVCVEKVLERFAHLLCVGVLRGAEGGILGWIVFVLVGREGSDDQDVARLAPLHGVAQKLIPALPVDGRVSVQVHRHALHGLAGLEREELHRHARDVGDAALRIRVHCLERLGARDACSVTAAARAAAGTASVVPYCKAMERAFSMSRAG